MKRIVHVNCLDLQCFDESAAIFRPRLSTTPKFEAELRVPDHARPEDGKQVDHNQK